MSTLYTYSGNNLSFTLGDSITISFVSIDEETIQLLFTLSGDGTFQGIDGDSLGANGKNSFMVSSNLVSGNFTITATNDSAHDVTFVKNNTLDNTYNVIDFKIAIGNGIILFQNGVKIVASGKIDIATMKNIRMSDVAIGMNQTLSGSAGITLVANENGQANNVANGIYLGRRNNIEANMGEISLKGHGGSNTGGTGVSINGGTVANESGNVKITGTGGMKGNSFNVGVSIQENSTVKGKSINITGVGSNDASNTGNHGISVNKATIESSNGQTEPGVFSVTLDGTGGSGVEQNIGVSVRSSAVKGNGVSITGRCSDMATGQFNNGILISGEGTIIDSVDGTVKLDGTATKGPGTNGNRGVNIGSGETSIVSGPIIKGQDILIIGTGGTFATSTFNDGISVTFNSMIEATNMVTLDGTGGSGSDQNRGVSVSLSTVKGNSVSITGNGNDTVTGQLNSGISIFGKSTIDSGDGTVILKGTATKGLGTNRNHGVDIQSGPTIKGKEVMIIGTGGTLATTDHNIGIFVINNSVIEATNGMVTLDGTSGSGTTLNHGVDIESGSIVKGKSINITGKRGGNTTADFNQGIFIYDNSMIEATDAPVTLTGTGGSGTDSNFGVNVEGSMVKGKGVNITGDGNINAVGQFNHGVFLFEGSQINALDATVALMGTGGTGTDGNRGVSIEESMITCKDITITGFGGTNATGEFNHGIFLADNSKINGDATITITGTSGKGSSDNRGVDIRRGTIIESVSSIVKITGTSIATAGKDNYGIRIDSVVASPDDTPPLPSQIKALENSITLDGTGGGGDDSYGTIIGDGGEINALEISVIGRATDPIYGVVQQRGGKFTGIVIVNPNVVNQKYFPDSEDQEIGINGDIIVDGALVVKIDKDAKNSQLVGTGSINLSEASLIIDDIENENTSDESAVYAIVAGDDITPFESYLNSATVTGTSGRRYRINYARELITLTSETGTSNIGVVIAGVDSDITSTSGNVTITGIGLDTTTNVAVAVVRATGPNNIGVQVRDGGSITSGGPTGLTITAIGSTDPTSTGTNTAFQLTNSGSLTSSTGPVTVVASGGNVENNGGVINAETVNVTQTGPVTINIVDKNNPPTPSLTSGTVDLSQSELVINDQGYQNGEEWIIVLAETVIPFKGSPSTVISNTGTLYLIEYTEDSVILTRVFEPEPEPDCGCICKPGYVNVQIDLDVCLNIKGKISGKISFC